RSSVEKRRSCGTQTVGWCQRASASTRSLHAAHRSTYSVRDPHPSQRGLKPRVATDRLPERLILVEDRNRPGVDAPVQQLEPAVVVTEGDVDSCSKKRPRRIGS